jgi:hypothetical protein
MSLKLYGSSPVEENEIVQQSSTMALKVLAEEPWSN